jgi:hypothetical protein
MRRLLGLVVALLSVGLAVGCDTGERSEPDPEEMARDRAHAIARAVADDAVREHFGALPAQLSKSETHCDSARYHDDERAYVVWDVWELSLALKDQERTLRAMHNSPGRFDTYFTDEGEGRFFLSGYDPDSPLSFTVRTTGSPTTVQLLVNSACLVDP